MIPKKAAKITHKSACRCVKHDGTEHPGKQINCSICQNLAHALIESLKRSKS